ncbi:hypothetical protein HS041_06495 [Planomonospora sp. ID67723]|uniref:hypothetical protein n=1 Tax=Planomonospora sp. ID67723 TaxID=2738134 RepID=UPI0018C35EBE|nr:hypothetical protein [Planomonospora sp. ID67723]MBG0827411.1 hypothetical protein [Planomonospora sp. ID67723]
MPHALKSARAIRLLAALGRTPPGRLVTALGRTPAGRLTLAEGATAVLFGMLTLPFSAPAHRSVPEWVQLAGVAVLLAMMGATAHTWRLVAADGLHLVRAARGGAATRLRDQARDERRLRRSLALQPAFLVVLLPVPETWMWFWFSLTLAAIASGAVSLALSARAHRRGPRA